MESTNKGNLNFNDLKLQVLCSKIVDNLNQKQISEKFNVSEKTLVIWFRPYKKQLKTVEGTEKLLNVLLRSIYKKQILRIQSSVLAENRMFTQAECKQILWLTGQIANHPLTD